MSNQEFFSAIKAGALDSIVEFLERDPTLVEQRDEDGATALHYAAMHGHREVVRLLVEKGADVNCTDSRFGATPTGWAIEYLRELGGVLAIEIEDVAFAIGRKDAELVARLLERFPVLREQFDSQGTSLRERAMKCGDPRIMRLFEADSGG